MSHPSLGLPPRDRNGGFPLAAEGVLASRERLAARAFEAAVAADPTIPDRHGPEALVRLRRDTATLLEIVASSVGSGDPEVARSWAEQAVPPFRRRAVPMDDLITLCEAIRAVVDGVIPPEAFAVASTAIDSAIRVFRWHRRLGGDARRRNRLLAFLYKGA